KIPSVKITILFTETPERGLDESSPTKYQWESPFSRNLQLNESLWSKHHLFGRLPKPHFSNIVTDVYVDIFPPP
ncbi:Hypothetical predicted protein, partial [Podarcis lilfordi]